MILRTTTTIDKTELRRLLRFASQDVHTVGVEVHVKNGATGNGGGYAYDHIPDVANVARKAAWLVTIRVPTTLPATAWSNVKRIRTLWPDSIPFDDVNDFIVFIGAHEFRHIDQYRRRCKGRCEYDAEHFAHRRLNEWRVETGRRPVQMKGGAS